MPSRAPLKAQSLQIIKERGVPVGTVLDVGVLTGTPELIAAFPQVRHMLFEPVEEFAANIARNYRKIPHELVCAAVGNSDGSVNLRVHRKIAGMDISHSGMVPDSEGGDEHVRTVQKISLDGYLRGRELPEPFLLKIDIDGHELQVIEGAQETLKRCSVVIVECAAHTLPGRITAVQKAGFTLFDLSEPCYYDQAFWQCDAIFIRSDLHAAAFKRIGTGPVEAELYTAFRG